MDLSFGFWIHIIWTTRSLLSLCCVCSKILQQESADLFVACKCSRQLETGHWKQLYDVHCLLFMCACFFIGRGWGKAGRKENANTGRAMVEAQWSCRVSHVFTFPSGVFFFFLLPMKKVPLIEKESAPLCLVSGFSW